MVLSRRRWLVAATLAVPAAALGLLAAEVVLARQGPHLAGPSVDYHAAGATTAVWVGDSTAVGVGTADAQDGVASRVGRARGERVVMLAVSGATAADVVDTQLDRVEGLAPAVVYVSVGANDVTHLTSPADFGSTYRQLLDRLVALPGVRVVALGVPDMGSPPRLRQPLRALAGVRGRQLDRVIRDQVRRHPGVMYVDIAGPTRRPFRDEPHRYFSADRYHPSAAGYELWARAVLEALGP